MNPFAEVIERINSERIRSDIFYLSSSPLPFRKANRTLPDHTRSTLDETDRYLVRQLRQWGYSPWKERCRAQAFGFDASKPRRHAYAMPAADSPWYDLDNIYAEMPGKEVPGEIILFVAHKDSQSWIDSPGAYDNAAGTATVLEFAHVLRLHPNRRTIRYLWCNEEHRPWTSVTAAAKSKERGEKLVAIFNVDSIGGKSQAEIEAGKKPNVTLYTTPEGKRLAELVTRMNELYRIGLDQRTEERKSPGDDDGSFVKAGFPAAVANLGSFPYADPNYHDLGDTAEKVDIANVAMAAKAILATALHVDRDGAP